MELIFHEKQEGSLCAQHCLNALLQRPYFSPVDLAELAQKLDESERVHMAEAGYSSKEYQQFLDQPSSNYDDSGFFSIQVLQQAVNIWGLQLEPFNSSQPVCQMAREDPRTAQGFVCNFREHWLTIRRIGNQWFNLNSLLTGPELISDTYLSLFLTQLRHEGYSIFVVLGDLPPCEANDLLKLIPAVQPIKPSLIGESSNKDRSGGQSRSRMSSSDDPELRAALEASRRLDEDDDESLKRALELSMLGFENESSSFDPSFLPRHSPPVNTDVIPKQLTTTVSPVLDQEEMRRRRLAYLDRAAACSSSAPTEPTAPALEQPGGTDALNNSASSSCTISPGLNQSAGDGQKESPPKKD